MATNSRNNYYGDLVVTTTFSIDHPNYIGKHLHSRRKGSNILILITLAATGAAFYMTNFIIAGIIAFMAGSWCFFNEKTIREINKDLESETVEIEGVVKKESEWVGFGVYPRTRGRGYVTLEDNKDTFRVDVTFVRRINVGQKVRFIYTPKFKFVKAWQLCQ